MYEDELRELDKILNHLIEKEGEASIPATKMKYAWRWEFLKEDGMISQGKIHSIKYAITPKGRIKIAQGGYVGDHSKSNATTTLLNFASVAAIVIVAIELVRLFFIDKILSRLIDCG